MKRFELYFDEIEGKFVSYRDEEPYFCFVGDTETKVREKAI